MGRCVLTCTCVCLACGFPEMRTDNVVIFVFSIFTFQKNAAVERIVDGVVVGGGGGWQWFSHPLRTCMLSGGGISQKMVSEEGEMHVTPKKENNGEGFV